MNFGQIQSQEVHLKKNSIDTTGNRYIKMSNRRVIKFKNRLASNTSDKHIAEAYSAASGFDVDLITVDNKVVSAHRFVLGMFSKHLAKTLNDCGFDGKIIGEFLMKRLGDS